MLRLLYILILLPFVGFSQLKTDSQLTNDLNNLVPNNTSQLIKPVHIRTVIQNGYDSRVSMYGETGILGKLTYASLFTFTDQKDLVNKKYVDDALVGFSGGVTSFNTRIGAITPLSTDYSAYYYPATGNPSGFLTSLSVTAPLTYLTNVLSMPAAATSIPGYVTASDQTFSGKKLFADGVRTTDIFNSDNLKVLGFGSIAGAPKHWIEIYTGPDAVIAVNGPTNANLSVLAKGTGKVWIQSPLKVISLQGIGKRVLEADQNGDVTATSRLNRTLSTYTIQLNYSANTEVDYFSYTIPANTLTTNGDLIEYEFIFFARTSSIAYEMSGLIQINGFEACRLTTNKTNGSVYALRLRLTRTTSSTVSYAIYTSNIDNTNEVLLKPTGAVSTLGGLDFTTAIVFKSRVSENDITNEILGMSARITFEPAP